MKKLLPQNRHMVKYALIGISAQFILFGVSWATGTGFKPKSTFEITHRAEKYESRAIAQTTPQQSKVITGKVLLSDDNQGAPGVTVFVKGTTTGTTTDANGNYTLNVPSQESILVFSFIGYVTKEIAVGTQAKINVTLVADAKALEEVVIVGYGEQKKESVIAAITQTKGAVLERAGGVQSIGAALTGNVPGVVTMASSGMPGEESPEF